MAHASTSVAHHHRFRPLYRVRHVAPVWQRLQPRFLRDTCALHFRMPPLSHLFRTAPIAACVHPPPQGRTSVILKKFRVNGIPLFPWRKNSAAAMQRAPCSAWHPAGDRLHGTCPSKHELGVDIEAYLRTNVACVIAMRRRTGRRAAVRVASPLSQLPADCAARPASSARSM